MNILIRNAVRFVLLAGLGCSGISSTVDYDSTMPTAPSKTFAWFDGMAPTQTPAERRVRRFIDLQLRNQGNSQTGNHPGFLVSYQMQMVGLKKNDLVLQINLHDPDSKNVLWQSTSRATLNLGDTPVEQDARVQAIVAEMLEKYPPRPPAPEVSAD